MKKFILISILILTQIFSLSSYAQTDDEQIDDQRTVFWIKLRLSYVRDPHIKAYRYQTSVINNRIYLGSIDDFSQNLWQAMANGNYILIGPFPSREEAVFAQKLYATKKINDSSLINNEKNYFWYLVRLGKYQRLNSYRFEHIPAAVAEGKLSEFIMNFTTASYNNSIVIGPFSSRIDAELSKRLYRKQE